MYLITLYKAVKYRTLSLIPDFDENLQRKIIDHLVDVELGVTGVDNRPELLPEYWKRWFVQPWGELPRELSLDHLNRSRP